MKLEDFECVIQNQTYSFRTEPNSKLSLVINTDSETCPHVSQIEPIKSDMTDESVALYNPGVIMIE